MFSLNDIYEHLTHFQITFKHLFTFIEFKYFTAKFNDIKPCLAKQWITYFNN